MLHKKSKRFLSVVLAAAMLFSMVPSVAFAGDAAPSDVTWTDVDSVEGLKTALSNGGNIKLSGDLTVDEALTLDSEKNVTLDLNGQTLSMSKKLTVKGTLTIQDSQAGGTISGAIGQMIDANGETAKVRLESGSISSTKYGAVRTQNKSTFEMTGGSVQGAPAIQAYSGNVTITGGSVLKTESTSYQAIMNTGATIVVGTENVAENSEPYVQGINVGSNKKVNLYSGVVASLAGTVASDSVLTCVFESDVTSALPSGKVAKLGEDGKYHVSEMTEADVAASVIDADGTEVKYGSVGSALNALNAGDTLKLYKDVDVTGKKPAIDITKADVTLDLNGHNVTCTNESEDVTNAYGVRFYKAKSTNIVIKNSANTPATITGYNAAVLATTNYSNQIAKVSVEGTIEFVSTKADAPTIELGYAALAYSEDAARAVKNGGFKATTIEDESYIYGTATAAMEADKDNTAVLLNNYTGQDSLAMSGGTGTINLNGFVYTYTSSNGDAVRITGSDTHLTIKNGQIISEAKILNDEWPAGVSILNTMSSGTPSTILPIDNVDLTLDGVKLVMENRGYGIVVNGIDSDINITLKNDSGVQAAEESIGIYFPVKSGELVIADSSVTGGTGIAVKGGNVTVSGDSVIQGTGEKYVPDNALNSGVNGTGDAIYLEGNYDRAANVKVESGTIVSENGKAVQMLFANEEGSTGPTTPEKTIVVSGGNFSSQVDPEYLDDTLKVERFNGQATDAPFSYYPSLEAAQEAAQPGDVIVDLSDVTAETTMHTITFAYNDPDRENSVLSVPDGKTITLPTVSRSGYDFLGWEDEAGTVHKAGEVVTCAAEMTFTAQWEKTQQGGGGIIAVPSYSVSIDAADNGSVSADRTSAMKGKTVTLTVTPDEGYVLDSLTVTDKNGDAVELTKVSDSEYTFTMPASKVSVAATFVKSGDEPAPSLPFVDVDPDAWYYDAVEYAYNAGLMTGTAADTFSPSLTTTRGMIVSILYRQEDEPAVTSDAGFADVVDGAYYEDAVNWAAEEGIVNGYSDTAFGPNDAITREQMAAILMNYAEYKGQDVTARADLSGYTDADTVSAWATGAVQWANAEGLINGMSDTQLAPKGSATRAQVAAILQRFLSE